MFTALTAAAVFFTGCPTGHDDTGESGDPNSEDGKTYILFQNANPYAVMLVRTKDILAIRRSASDFLQ